MMRLIAVAIRVRGDRWMVLGSATPGSTPEGSATPGSSSGEAAGTTNGKTVTE